MNDALPNFKLSRTVVSRYIRGTVVNAISDIAPGVEATIPVNIRMLKTSFSMLNVNQNHHINFYPGGYLRKSSTDSQVV